eukprot:2960247-Alexandrium_andersonii.AAC.1
MSASLVGSEMCIRDRFLRRPRWLREPLSGTSPPSRSSRASTAPASRAPSPCTSSPKCGTPVARSG